jgi:hypothetical protein
MNIVREHINERLGFTEDSDPISDMGIGIGFGFTFALEGLEHNDCKHNLYVNEQFIQKYCRALSPKTFILKGNFYARFKSGPVMAMCSFYFKPTTVTKGNQTKNLYYTAGNAGSRGFNGGEQSRTYHMRSTTIKNVLGQLYNHMLKLQ